MDKSDSVVTISSHTTFTNRHFILFCLSGILFSCSMFYRTSNAIIAPQLQNDLFLSHEALGSLSAAFFYSFAIMQVPMALLIDRLGARFIMTALTMVGAVGSFVFAFSPGYGMALVGRVLLGCGMAGNFIGGLKLFTSWFSAREFATVSGLYAGIGTLGSFMASTPLAVMVDTIGWRASFGITGAGTALTAFLFYTLIRDTPFSTPANVIEESRRPRTSANLARLFRSRDYWLISCGAFFRYGTLMSIQGLWAGPYLLECLRLSPVHAGNLIMLITIGYVIGCSAGGWLSDRVLASRKYVVVLGLIGMTAISLCLTLSWGQSSDFPRACVFFGLGLFSGACNVMYAHIKEVVPFEMAGMALTGINFFTMLGVGVYIHVMGWVMDHMAEGKRAGMEEYQVVFSLALAGLALATILYLFTKESREIQKHSGAGR
ncbi:MAG: MFS transporter [Syntrophobacter sp.]